MQWAKKNATFVSFKMLISLLCRTHCVIHSLRARFFVTVRLQRVQCPKCIWLKMKEIGAQRAEWQKGVIFFNCSILLLPRSAK